MSSPYIPHDEDDALNWMTAFSSGISADSALYQLSAADATAISAAVQAFADAKAITNIPATRIEVTIQDKDNARVAAEQICRQYAMLIKFNAGISESAKINVGVRPPNTSRIPIDAPSTSPILSPIASTPGSQTVRYSDSMSPDSSSKPFGSTDLLLFVAVSDVNETDPATATFVGKFTKNPVSVEFGAGDNGKQATYFGRWSNAKGEMGPWSIPVSLAIAA